MATLVNIRIHTQAKAVHDADYVAINKVTIEGNTIVAEGGDVRYVLDVVPMENIVVETPSNSTECGCNTTNANIFATLIKGVDGITPDMSDYYNKEVIEEKLATKQDAISDSDITSIKTQVALNAVNINALDQRVMVTFVDGEDGDVVIEGNDDGTVTPIYEDNIEDSMIIEEVDNEVQTIAGNDDNVRTIN